MLSEKAIELLTLLGDKGVQRVYTTLGPEQEYFLIDRTHFAMRPDLIMSNRTLVGAAPPRGQQLEDHYFGGIPERIQACISEVEYELYKLGVPIMTRHNEVAPCQFEMAPMYEETDIAVDHNQLVMSVLRRVALRHGLQAIVHEKPFAGVNGSGQALQLVDGDHVGERPRRDQPAQAGQDAAPEHPLPRLPRRRAARACTSTPGCCAPASRRRGNEHRLGANEAPPAIISVFMGGDAHAGDRGHRRRQGGGRERRAGMLISLGVDKLPEIEKDNTDRNRTSPFAFTGNKFEFRAVGASQSIAFPVTLLNAAVAEARGGHHGRSSARRRRPPRTSTTR